MTNYAKKGAARENRILRDLRAEGYWAMRAPASKGEGALDIIAIKAGRILVVQVKSGELKRTTVVEWNALWELAIRLGAVPVVVQIQDRRPPLWWEITGRKTGVQGVRSPCVPFALDEVAAALEVDEIEGVA